jgi:Tol biopolymer transport system component
MNSYRLLHLCWPLLAFCLVILACGPDACKTSEPECPDYKPLYDHDPKWSHEDSTQIAYTHYAKTWEELQQYGQFSIWVVNLETLEKEYITVGFVFDWSPDGSQLLFARSDWRLRLVDLASRTEELLPVQGGHGDFSPCGTKIAFSGGEETTGTWILDLETGAARWVCEWFHADWSPAGTTLVCDYIKIVGEDGTEIGQIEVGDEFGQPRRPRWSPTGDIVAYEALCELEEGCGRSRGIWAVGTDGSNIRLLACGVAEGFSWSPDGSKIAYSTSSTDSTGCGVWVVNMDGTGRTQVTVP